VSKGCIRMVNEDVLDLYPRVPVGTKVTVTWQRFTTQAIADDGSSSYTAPMAAGPSYKSAPRPIRVRTPGAEAETVAATTGDMGVNGVNPNADDATLAAAAEKPLETKPAKKAETHKKVEAATATVEPAAKVEAKPATEAKPAAHEAKPVHEAKATPVAHDAAAAAAEKAAAAATKAAEAAAKAAEAARKAADDAKKAADHPDDAGKSASL
jgi:hypothetical protein